MAPVDRKKHKNTKKTSSLANNNKIKKKTSQKKLARMSKHAQFKECLTCPKCKQLLVGANAIRVRPCPKLSTNMQKLLRKKKESEESLTEHQRHLLNKAMQRCGLLVLKCVPCKWQAKVKLQTRETLHKHRAQLRHRAERERQKEEEGKREESTVTLDKKTLHKLKKKERRKKSAEAKLRDQQLIKRSATSTPVRSATEGKSETPTESSHLPSPAATPSLQKFSPGTTPSKPEMSVSGIAATPQQGIKTSQNSNTSGIVAKKPHLKTSQNSNTFSTVASPHQMLKSPHNSKAVSQPGNTRTADSPRSVSGVQRGKVQKLGKQQLKRMLNQKTPAKLTASESLSQFLDCLK